MVGEGRAIVLALYTARPSSLSPPSARLPRGFPRDRRHAISGASPPSRHLLPPDLFISPHQTHIAREQALAPSTPICSHNADPNSPAAARAATHLSRRLLPGSCVRRSSISKGTSKCVRCIVPKWVVRLCVGQTRLSTRACARGTPVLNFIPGTRPSLALFRESDPDSAGDAPLVRAASPRWLSEVMHVHTPDRHL